MTVRKTITHKIPGDATSAILAPKVLWVRWLKKNKGVSKVSKVTRHQIKYPACRIVVLVLHLWTDMWSRRNLRHLHRDSPGFRHTGELVRHRLMSVGTAQMVQCRQEFRELQKKLRLRHLLHLNAINVPLNHNDVYDCHMSGPAWMPLSVARTPDT